MALPKCHIAFPPLRAVSFRPKFNPNQIQRILSFHTTHPSRQTTQVSTTPTTWVDRLPAKVKPYLYLTRIDKPIGTLLLFYPCGASPQLLVRVGAAHVTNPSRIPYITAWSITMASYALNVPPSVPLKYTLLFGTGALIMRGAGCTINDLWDRNLDNAVGTSFQPSIRHARPPALYFIPLPFLFFFIRACLLP